MRPPLTSCHSMVHQGNERIYAEETFLLRRASHQASCMNSTSRPLSCLDILTSHLLKTRKACFSHEACWPSHNQAQAHTNDLIEPRWEAPHGAPPIFITVHFFKTRKACLSHEACLPSPFKYCTVITPVRITMGGSS